MRAIRYHRYGSPDVLQVEEVERPVPGANEALVRVRATSVNPRDWHFMRGSPYIMRPSAFGLRGPKDPALGSDVAGTVEAVGTSVTTVRPGDRVYAFVDSGAFAEYARVPEDRMSAMPANLSFEQAASVPLAAPTALQGLRDSGALQAGQRVLVIGASGGVGTFAVQIARALGAEVTGVCSTRSAETVRSIGADHVIDYTQEDFTRSGQAWDVIFQLAGQEPASTVRRALTPEGTLVLSSGDAKGHVFGPMGRILRAMVTARFASRGQKINVFEAHPAGADLEVLREMIEAGTVTPVIDRTYPFEEIPEAIRQLEAGHARGKIVVTVDGGA
jgi:NADPH:quinone reductase-like Zn-dependent oxidoreductase